MAAERQTLLDLADCYFLIEGEDPKLPSEYYTKKKMEVWSKDPECEAFFLTAANSSIQNFSELSDTDLLQYLKNPQTRRKNARVLKLD